LAHTDEGTHPCDYLEQLDAYHFGYLVYFFEKAMCDERLSARSNPFNQPGVEDYKTNMFALLERRAMRS
jgi:glucose-6-phosphate isomerase